MSMRVWKYCRQAHCDDGLPMITAQNEMLDAYIIFWPEKPLPWKTAPKETATASRRSSVRQKTKAMTFC